MIIWTNVLPNVPYIATVAINIGCQGKKTKKGMYFRLPSFLFISLSANESKARGKKFTIGETFYVLSQFNDINVGL